MGVSLRIAADFAENRRSKGPRPKFVHDGNLTPDFLCGEHDAATLPAEQKTNPRRGGDPAYADPGEPDHAAAAKPLPDDRRSVIGKGRQAGRGMPAPGRRRSRARMRFRCPISKTHHQPFNYFASMAPGTAGAGPSICGMAGLGGSEFIKGDRQRRVARRSPSYKPQGNLNEQRRLCRCAGMATAILPMFVFQPAEKRAMGAHGGDHHL